LMIIMYQSRLRCSLLYNQKVVAEENNFYFKKYTNLPRDSAIMFVRYTELYIRRIK
jgi:hypothetical protein